ncbi:MAG TPA: hypothetical protein ENJ42_08465, partial [Hellea balneolensis]|nr:hypothetical protein [Hellea balneolensis]
MSQTQMQTKKSKDLSPETERFLQTHGVIWFVWILFLVMGWMRSGAGLLRGELPGNDDNMRMVEIRDWLGGQSWFDLHQYRLNPSAPLNSHWSRISDVLIGGPIKIMTPLFGSETAELIAVVAYPSILLLVFFYLLVAITRRLTPSM